MRWNLPDNPEIYRFSVNGRFDLFVDSSVRDNNLKSSYALVGEFLDFVDRFVGVRFVEYINRKPFSVFTLAFIFNVKNLNRSKIFSHKRSWTITITVPNKEHRWWENKVVIPLLLLRYKCNIFLIVSSPTLTIVYST